MTVDDAGEHVGNREPTDRDRIRRDDPMPLYRQLKAVIARDIRTGVLAPGASVGPESVLSQRFDVSRITVRQALGELQSEGLIVRQVGKGTYVRQEPSPGRQPRLAGFAEDMRLAGSVPSYRVVSVTREQPSDEIGEQLDLGPGGQSLCIVRVLLADDAPVAIARSHLSLRLIGDLADDLNARTLERCSLYELLEDRLGIVLARASESVAPDHAGPDATLLDIESSDLVLVVQRRVFDASGRCIEAVGIRYVADRYRYRVELGRD
jgi:GntR family transcriptional regulator